MSIVRLLSILLIVVSVSSAGSMSVAHDSGRPEAAGIGVEAHPDCCDADAEMPMDCHVPAAVFSSAVETWIALTSSRTVTIPGGSTLAGMEPGGLLDPPRSV